MAEIWWTLAGSIVVGAAGYMLATFWFQPILRYRSIKYQVASDLVFYANAITLTRDTGVLRDDTLARITANRSRAAELKAIWLELPTPYRSWLKTRHENPLSASSALIGLSNADGHKAAQECIDDVKKHLRLPSCWYALEDGDNSAHGSTMNQSRGSPYTVVPKSLLALSVASLGIAILTGWSAGLELRSGLALFAGLEGTACLASAFAPSWEVGAAAPRRSLDRFLWLLTHAASYRAAPAYYPVPFYLGLALLALSIVLSALAR